MEPKTQHLTIALPAAEVVTKLDGYSQYLSHLFNALSYVMHTKEHWGRYYETCYKLVTQDISLLAAQVKPFIIDFAGLQAIYLDHQGTRYDTIRFSCIDNNMEARLECVNHLRPIVTEVLTTIRLLPPKQSLIAPVFPDKDVSMKDNASQTQIIINGNYANVVNESSHISQTITVRGLDKSQLKTELEKLQVSTEDIIKVLELIDNNPKLSNGLPTKINEWIAKMTSKAATKAWEYGEKIGIAASAKLLSDLLSGYYNLSLDS